MKAVLVISFGTSFENTRKKNIDAIEADIAAAYPDCRVMRAFTSTIIMKKLAGQGLLIPDTAVAVEALLAEGVTDLVVQPTHLMHGFEYDKLCGMLEPYWDRFASVRVGHPLLDTTEDLQIVVDTLGGAFDLAPDEGLVLMGHGTEHFANAVYAALDYMFKDRGYPRVFVGTVEGYPELESVMKQLKSTGIKKLILAPLMLVAGDHAVNDMASDEENSWRTQLEAAGYGVRCVIKGLGEYEAIRALCPPCGRCHGGIGGCRIQAGVTSSSGPPSRAIPVSWPRLSTGTWATGPTFCPYLRRTG